MKILLCHERFIFRFGVDRVLLLLAREFRASGLAVSFAGYEFDADSLAAADRILQIPEPDDYYQRDVNTLRWLENNWAREFGGDNQPDVVLSAGWPFLSCIPFFERRGTRVFYQDHGLIPTEGLPDVGKRALGLLGELKETFLPQATGIVAISRFILESQSRLAAGRGQKAVSILHGADHAGRDLWQNGRTGELAAFGSRPRPRILLLGRFEPGTHKCSQLVFDLEKRVRTWAPGAWFGVLASEADIKSAANGGTEVVALGHISDAGLYAAIRESDVCVSLSEWEGFNLPLAEAQALGRPCLVFNRGAHSEVVANPWLLCDNIDEMAEKARAIVEKRAPRSVRSGEDFRRFAKKRTWGPVAEEYLRLFATSARVPALQCLENKPAGSDEVHGSAGRWVLVDVTNAGSDKSNTGCVRVARRLGAELQLLTKVLFIAWDREHSGFRFPTTEEFDVLALFRGPTRPERHPVSDASEVRYLADWMRETGVQPAWLVLPEIRHPEEFQPVMERARELGIKTAAVFHDAIPILRPELVTDARYRDTHFEYMCGLADCQAVLANSHYSEDCLLEFWREQGLTGPAMTCVLPGGTAGRRPAVIPEAERGFEGRKFLLCVSTIEPRKNHRRMVESFLQLKAAQPGFDLELVLVGNRYAGARDLGDWLDQLTREQRGVRWLGVVTDEQLTELYRNCEFTIYPSEIEGFGLPIVESIWYGRPCLCHNQGVMAELAREGGCLTAELTDVAAFREAITALVNDPDLRTRLEAECQARSIKRWSDYAAEFLSLLATKYWSELAIIK